MTPKIGYVFAKNACIFCLFWYNLYLYVYLNCLIVFNSKIETRWRLVSTKGATESDEVVTCRMFLFYYLKLIQTK